MHQAQARLRSFPAAQPLRRSKLHPVDVVEGEEVIGAEGEGHNNLWESRGHKGGLLGGTTEQTGKRCPTGSRAKRKRCAALHGCRPAVHDCTATWQQQQQQAWASRPMNLAAPGLKQQLLIPSGGQQAPVGSNGVTTLCSVRCKKLCAF